MNKLNAIILGDLHWGVEDLNTMNEASNLIINYF